MERLVREQTRRVRMTAGTKATKGAPAARRRAARLCAAVAHGGEGGEIACDRSAAPKLCGKMYVPRNVVSKRVFLVLRAAPEASCAVGEVRLTYQARGFCN